MPLPGTWLAFLPAKENGMRILKVLLSVLLWVSVVFFLLPTDHYYLDLLQSFTFHAFLVYLFLTVLFALLRWRVVAVSGVSVCFLLLVHLLPHIHKSSSEEYQLYGQPFRVAHFNVLANNTSYEKSIRKAKHTDADLISFQEVNMQWINQLIDKLESDYPYYAFVDGEYHGVAVFSRYPIKNVKSYYWTGEPTLTGDVQVEGQQVHFVTTHTLSPRSPERSRNRNQHLQKITEYVSNVEGPVMAIGDFNTVPWSHPLTYLKERAKLRDSRKSLAPTYPATYRLGIPIDYILHSEELSCLRFDAVQAGGSDHKGVIGDYMFTGPEAGQTM